MKSFKLFIFLMLYTIAMFAQDRAALTKEETVNYINKKLAEVIKSGAYENDKSQQWYCWKQTSALAGTDLTITHSVNNDRDEEFGSYFKRTGFTSNGRAYEKRHYSCDYSKFNTEIKFNPAYIKSFEIHPNNNETTGVGRILITLSSKTAKISSEEVYTYDEEGQWCLSMEKRKPVTSVTAEFEIYFLQADNTNFNKLKKAFEHLRDLVKAEEDPFGN
jgi:carboxypeptidase C (cathepsin A)